MEYMQQSTAGTAGSDPSAKGFNAPDGNERRGFLRWVVGLAAGAALLHVMGRRSKAETKQRTAVVPGNRPAGTTGYYPFIGEIQIFGGTFAPTGWALCNGQLLSITDPDNQALFSLIGTKYGGDGVNTFALPNLCARAPLGTSSSYPAGNQYGEATHTLTTGEMPGHTHACGAASSAGTRANPAGAILAANAEGVPHYGNTPNCTLAPVIGVTGGGAAHNNIQPYLGMNFIIALQGDWPMQS